MAPCSNNEILKASVTYNHTAKGGEEKREQEREREKNAGSLISYKLGFKKPNQSGTNITFLLLLGRFFFAVVVF